MDATARDYRQLRAIDVHTHVLTGDRARAQTREQKQAEAYFGVDDREVGLQERADMYRNLNMMAVIFDVDFESSAGLSSDNDDIAEAVDQFPDVFIGFGTVDPWKGKAAVAEIRRVTNQLQLQGIKFQQITQHFDPGNRRFYPLYEAICEANVPVVFHMGTTGIGAGTPGGGGYQLKYGRPLLIDDVAADFPELTIIAAHPGWPWHNELLAVAMHKSNVNIDLSGWAPKYLPESVFKYANSLLQDRVLFGTDYPFLSPERYFREFESLEFKPEVERKIFVENAIRVLGLDEN